MICTISKAALAAPGRQAPETAASPGAACVDARSEGNRCQKRRPGRADGAGEPRDPGFPWQGEVEQEDDRAQDPQRGGDRLRLKGGAADVKACC